MSSLLPTLYYRIYFVLLSLDTVKGKGKGRQFVLHLYCNLHRREHAHASNALSSLTRAACRTATVCSLQTQAGAAAS